MHSRSTNWERHNSRLLGVRAKRAFGYAVWLRLFFVSIMASGAAFAATAGPSSTPSLLNPASTPAHDIYHLSLFVMAICLGIFLVVFSLIVYAAVKYRKRPTDDGHEPPQIYGSNQVELAWTVIPILIVLVLFFATARVIHSVQDAPEPRGTIEVIAIGHQFWWEFR